MKKNYLLCAIILLLTFVFAFPAAAEEETQNADYDPEYVSLVEAQKEEPFVYIASRDAEVGDMIGVNIALGNVTGFTSGEFVIQYNPYRLQFEGFKASRDMGYSSIYIQTTEATGEGVTDIYGNIAHEVYISMLHMDKFPSSLDDCSVGTINFKVIGGGECDLELTAMSFQIEEVEVTPLVYSGVVQIEGEKADDWDYAAITSANITVPEGQYEVDTSKKLSTPLKIVLIVAVLVLIGVVIFFVARSSTVIDESEEEDADGQSDDEEEQADEAGAANSADAPAKEPEAEENADE